MDQNDNQTCNPSNHMSCFESTSCIKCPCPKTNWIDENQSIMWLVNGAKDYMN